ncbi:MAG: putative ABC transporter permease [Oscillospiraceae bacterium]|nr:putative ABC transporter permease [Oscillospiraceae bacterium]
MKKGLNKNMKYFFLFLIGGFVYGAIEVVFKGGDTHLSMFILGGLCFLLIGALSRKMHLLLRMSAGAAIITVLEFLCGIILNVWLQIGVWDYSHLPLNVMGQICLWFTIIWFFLSFVGIQLDNLVKWQLFGGERPVLGLRRKNTAIKKTA